MNDIGAMTNWDIAGTIPSEDQFAYYGDGGIGAAYSSYHKTAYLVGGRRNGAGPTFTKNIWYSQLGQPDFPCDHFTTTDFGPPMGKKKKVGSTIPIKFQLFYDGTEIRSQDQLDTTLTESCQDPACPEIVISDVTTEANAIELQLPEDLDNVGEGGDLGECFRYSALNWIYKLKLDSQIFRANSTYLVEVEIGECLLTPGNEVFQTK